MMKYCAVILCSLLLSGAVHGFESDLIFHHQFDGNLTAAFAHGAAELEGEIPPEYLEGVSGKALVIGGKASETQRYYTVSAKNNILSKQGTVSLWVKPLDWNGDTPSQFFHIFMAVQSEHQTMLIYRFFNSDNLLFWLNSTNLSSSVRGWRENEWRHIAAVWNESEIKLYVNGQTEGVFKLKYANKEFDSRTKVAVGPYQWKDGSDGKSLIDEVRIYAEPLKEMAIRQLYSEFSDKACSRLNFLYLCGRPGGEKYTFHGSGWRDLSGFVTDPNLKWSLGSDGKELFLRLDPPDPAEVLLYADGTITRHELKGGEATIPFSGKDIRLNIVRNGKTLAPVSGFPEDVANFFHLYFTESLPLVKINRFYDEKGMALDIECSGKLDTVYYFCISDTKQSYGINTRTCKLLDNGTKVENLAYRFRSEPTGEMLWYTLGFDLLKNNQRERFFQTVWKYDNRQPGRTSFLYTKIKEKKLKISSVINSPVNLKLTMTPRNGDIPLLEKTIRLDGAIKYPESELDISTLPPGNYNIAMQYFTADGTPVSSFEQEYQIPDSRSNVLKPYQSRIKGIPAPWTALQVNGTTASMWGRSYDFADGVLVSSLLSQNQEMLTEPVFFMVDNQKLSPVSKPDVKLVSTTPMSSVWKKTADLGQFKTETDLTVHFDGLCEVKMKLKGPFSCKSLSLNIPLKKELATLLRDSKIVSAHAPHSGNNGLVGNYLKDHFEGGYQQACIRIGNEDIGFNWMSQSLEDWHCQGRHFFEVDNGMVRLHLSDMKWDLPEVEEHTFSFWFTLTPTRPMPEISRSHRMGRYYQTWIQPWEHFNYPEKGRIRLHEIKRSLNGYKEGFLYFSRFFIGPYAPEWGYWQEEWLTPGDPLGSKTGGDYQDTTTRNYANYVRVNAVPSYHNFWLNQFSAFVDEMPVYPGAENYYFDYCIDTLKTPDGKKITALESTRRMGMEIFVMTKAKNPASKIMYHTSFQRAMPAIHFTDYMLEGEGPEPMIARDLGYFNIYTPEYVRASFLSSMWGVRIAIIPQHKRALDLFSPAVAAVFDPENPKFRKGILHFYGYMVTHDLEIQYAKELGSVVSLLINAQDELGWNDDVKFHPYWKKDSSIKTLTTANGKILVSAYTNSGRLMLAALNDTDSEQNVQVLLDLKKLGVEAGLKGVDAYDPTSTWTLSSEWQANVPPRGFRLLVFQ